MAETITIPLNERIKSGLDGRTNKWLIDRLADKGIILSPSAISQRLSGITEWTGEEAIACFEILNLEIKTENV